MGKLIVLFCLAFVVVQALALATNCPLSSKMTTCSPKCKDDTECHGEKCCPNICNTKSCSQANQHSQDSKYGDKQKGGTGSYCGNVKCNSYEKCDLDKSTKRQICVRT